MKQESKISVQVNRAETDWRGFLVDEDASPVLAHFERAKRATARTDRDIVREAKKNKRTIITSNGWDFVRYIQEFQNPPNNPGCRDLWGLLVIPNLQLIRERDLKAIQHGLDVPRLGRLRWPAAGMLNLYVRLTDEGQAEIRRFKRCDFCENDVEIRPPWNAWYYSLSATGAHHS